MKQNYCKSQSHYILNYLYIDNGTWIIGLPLGNYRTSFGKMNTTTNSCDVLLDLTNSSVPSHLQHSHREQIIANVLWSFFLTFGLITNATFIVVVAKISYMQNVTNAYLCNLAISDLVYLISTGTDALLQYNWSTIPRDDSGKGLMGCRVLIILSVLCFMESTFLVTLVTFERFVAIRFPLFYRHVKGPRRTFTLIFISWTASLLLAVSALPVFAGDIESYCIQWPKDPEYRNHPYKFQVCTPRKEFSIRKTSSNLVDAGVDITGYFQRINVHWHNKNT